MSNRDEERRNNLSLDLSKYDRKVWAALEWHVQSVKSGLVRLASVNRVMEREFHFFNHTRNGSPLLDIHESFYSVCF